MRECAEKQKSRLVARCWPLRHIRRNDRAKAIRMNAKHKRSEKESSTENNKKLNDWINTLLRMANGKMNFSEKDTHLIIVRKWRFPKLESALCTRGNWYRVRFAVIRNYVRKCSDDSKEPPPASMITWNPYWQSWAYEIGNSIKWNFSCYSIPPVMPPPSVQFLVCVIMIWRRERDVKKRFNSRRNVYSTSAHSAYIFFLFCSHRSNHTWR